MENQKVHEYTVVRGPAGPVAQIGKVHNLITFVQGGHGKVHYYDGRWVDDGGNALDPKEIPDHFKKQVELIPFRPTDYTDRGPDVLIPCEFCDPKAPINDEGVPSREYAQHLIRYHMQHVKKSDDELPAANGEYTATVRVRPEDLPEGNYATDDEGFVMFNEDGTPRKRVGRPKKSA